MAAIDYVELRRKTDISIRESGGRLVVKLIRSERDAASGEVDQSLSTYAGAALKTSYALKDVDGSLIQINDSKFLVSALQDNGNVMPKPVMGSELTFGSQIFEVMECKPLEFDGVTVVMYTVQGRAVANS